MPDIKNKKRERPIGVFDSGIGGLSVLRELEKLLPHENFVFLADQKYVPYGEKSKKELIGLAYRIADFFIQNYNTKMIVVACNTSTCYSLSALRKKYSLPIVGTVPAVKKAAENTRRGTVVVMSTPATSKSKTLKKLIKDYCYEVNVLNIGCRNLENIVENGNISDTKLLRKYLGQAQRFNTDSLVLGCTHYVFLKDTIRKILGANIKLIDGNLAIAKRTNFLLKMNKIKTTQKKKGGSVYFTTGSPEKFSKVASALLKKRIQAKKAAI